jgi:hypothetical protein
VGGDFPTAGATGRVDGTVVVAGDVVVVTTTVVVVEGSVVGTVVVGASLEVVPALVITIVLPGACEAEAHVTTARIRRIRQLTKPPYRL